MEATTADWLRAVTLMPVTTSDDMAPRRSVILPVTVTLGPLTNRACRKHATNQSPGQNGQPCAGGGVQQTVRPIMCVIGVAPGVSKCFASQTGPHAVYQPYSDVRMRVRWCGICCGIFVYTVRDSLTSRCVLPCSCRREGNAPPYHSSPDMPG